MKKLTSAPYLLWMAIFVVVPLFMVAYFAFTDQSGAFTLENIIKTGQYTPIFVKSIAFAAISTAICLLLAYPLSYILSTMKVSYQGTMLLIIMLPMWMNFLLRTYAWQTLLGNNGIINNLLGVIGIGPFKLLNTNGAVILGMVYDYIPFMILPLYTVMAKIDKSIIEAAEDLGCSRIQSIIKITVPLSIPGIISGITMVFVPAISTFIISKMLGGSSNLLIGDLIEMQFLGNSYNPNLGAGIAFVLMIIILIVMAVINLIDKSDSDDKVLM
ncbi:MAG: ABC transporter permease [Clostridia bacterium]|nr:ABC transporter permease [Clostridia bacterium]